MHKIVSNNIDHTKVDYIVSTQAAATLTIGDTELGIFVGTAVVAINNQRCISALVQLRDALKEANFPDGAAADNFAHVTPPDGKQGVTVGNAVAIPVLTESEIVIAYGGLYASPGRSQIFIGHINRMIEVFQEQILKLT